jgi:ubiquinone/menaquinone biosynthesis C-methylase UbiE
MARRIPLPEEPIAGTDAVRQYDKGARYYIMPEYKYFAWKILSRGIKSGRVLDIGTGSGRLAIEIARSTGTDFDITAMDISPDMIKLAIENAKLAGVESKISFVVSTAAALPFPDFSFDLVVSYASLHHWLEPLAVFNEAARVVKESGQVIIRDNKRLHGPFWKSIIWLITRFMNRRHRENWPRAILAGYTIPEIREVVSRSRLRNWQVKSDFVLVDLSVETSGKK